MSGLSFEVSIYYVIKQPLLFITQCVHLKRASSIHFHVADKIDRYMHGTCMVCFAQYFCQGTADGT